MNRGNMGNSDASVFLNYMPIHNYSYVRNAISGKNNISL